jgi:ABC-type lipoprotein release transport system permease subunit
MGVLSALPIISIGNACCCMWVVSGGLVAAYLLQQNTDGPITPGDGALVGLLAGFLGCIIGFLISIPVGFLVEPMERAMVQRTLEMSGQMPPEVREILENYGARRSSLGILGMVVIRILGFFVALFVSSIFSTLGGLLGAAIFQKRLPPGTIDVPPAAAP